MEGARQKKGLGPRLPLRFTLDARGEFHFDARTQANPLHWSLLGPKGIEVDGLSFSSSDGNNANDSVLRLEPGDSPLSVNALGDWTGHYEFRFSNLNSGRLIAPDTDVGGKLVPGNQTQLYQFLAWSITSVRRNSSSAITERCGVTPSSNRETAALFHRCARLGLAVGAEDLEVMHARR